MTNHRKENCYIEGYDLLTSHMINNDDLNVSRVVVFVHESIVAKVRDDLMSDDFSSIWLEVGFPGTAKILLCNLYREWQYIGQADNSSLNVHEQLNRWITFLEQWEKALDSIPRDGLENPDSPSLFC